MAFGLVLGRARVAELADAPDLGSGGQPWGFESPLSHPPAISGRFMVLMLAHHVRGFIASFRARKTHMAGLGEGVAA